MRTVNHAVRAPLTDIVRLAVHANGRYLPDLLRLNDRYLVRRKIVQFPRRTYLVGHPDHLDEALRRKFKTYIRGRNYDVFEDLLGQAILTSTGSVWQYQRQSLQPFFNKQLFPTFQPYIDQAIERMTGRLGEASAQGKPVNLHFEWRLFALDIVFRLFFNVDYYQKIPSLIEDFQRIGEQLWPKMLFSGVFAPLMGYRSRVFAALQEKLRSVTDEIFDKSQPSLFGNLLERMKNRQTESPGDLPLERIKQNILTFLFTGHETSALSMTWAQILAAENPHYREEMEAALFASPEGSDYISRWIQETLRLRSPFLLLPREALADDEIDGVSIPKGSKLKFFLYGAHFHPEYWEKPREFYPEHFRPEATEGRHRCAFLPFGAGPHGCIGGTFALFEMLQGVERINQRFVLTPAFDLPMPYRSLLALEPAVAPRFYVTERP